MREPHGQHVLGTLPLENEMDGIEKVVTGLVVALCAAMALIGITYFGALAFFVIKAALYLFR